MKQKNIWFLILLMFLLLPLMALAAPAPEKKNAEAGILPDSFWFWADEFGEELRFFFTPGNDRKLEYLQTTMDERLAEKDALNAEGTIKYNDILDSRLDRMKVMMERFSGQTAVSGQAATGESGQSRWEKIKSYFK